MSSAAQPPRPKRGAGRHRFRRDRVAALTAVGDVVTVVGCVVPRVTKTRQLGEDRALRSGSAAAAATTSARRRSRSTRRMARSTTPMALSASTSHAAPGCAGSQAAGTPCAGAAQRSMSSSGSVGERRRGKAEHRRMARAVVDGVARISVRCRCRRRTAAAARSRERLGQAVPQSTSHVSASATEIGAESRHRSTSIPVHRMKDRNDGSGCQRRRSVLQPGAEHR